MKLPLSPLPFAAAGGHSFRPGLPLPWGCRQLAAGLKS